MSNLSTNTDRVMAINHGSTATHSSGKPATTTSTTLSLETGDRCRFAPTLVISRKRAQYCLQMFARSLGDEQLQAIRTMPPQRPFNRPHPRKPAALFPQQPTPHTQRPSRIRKRTANHEQLRKKGSRTSPSESETLVPNGEVSLPATPPEN